MKKRFLDERAEHMAQRGASARKPLTRPLMKPRTEPPTEQLTEQPSGADFFQPLCDELTDSFNALPDALWLVDPSNLQVLWANTAAGTLMNVAANQLVGMDVLSALVCPEDMFFWAEVSAGLSEVIESRTLLKRADGSTLPVLRTVRTVQLPTRAADAQTSSRMLLITLRDLTEQLRVEHALEDRLAQLNATLESSGDGILVTDLNGNIRNFNRRFAQLWRVPAVMLTVRDDDAVLGWMRRSVVDARAYMQRLAAIDDPAFDAPSARVCDLVRLRHNVTLERTSLPQCSRGLTIGRVYAFREVSHLQPA